MEFLEFACVFILISGFYQDVTVEKPEIFPREDEIFIEEYKELRLECYSRKATIIQFSYPESEIMMPRSNHEILKSKNGTYIFLRSSMTLSDAGWYACAEEGVRIDNDFRNLNHSDEDVSWIYVYVNSTSVNKFASTSVYEFPITVIVVAGSTMVVPCRPASPTVEVKLWHNFKLAESDDILRFDPKIGFVMKRVDFLAGEASLECKTKFFTDSYILRYSGPKPKMITPNHKDLILQENDELRIECYSETNVSFMFPNIMDFNSSIQSEYNITVNNGLHTFLRPSAISNDTGWYGCAGEGIVNDISYHAINEMKKEIDWIYVYVNSSVPITQGLMIYRSWKGSTVVPCRPTSPYGPHIHLNNWYPNILDGPQMENIPFDPKLGFVVKQWPHTRTTFYCTTDDRVDYVSQNYRVYPEIVEPWAHVIPTVVDADDLLVSGVQIIRMSGEDLRMVCERFISDVSIMHLKWKVPSTVSEARVQYTWSRSKGRFQDSMHLRGKKLMITITNLTETDTGDYNCTVSTGWGDYATSRFVNVFDKNGGRYIKLDKHGGEMHVTGLKDGTIKWLVDLEYFPSAEIKWSDPLGNIVKVSNESTSLRYVTDILKRGAPQKLFIMHNLTLGDSGIHNISAHLETGESTHITVTLNVQAPSTASIRLYSKSQKDSYTKGERVSGTCFAHGTPLPNVTWSFTNCPKFPSQDDSIPMSSKELITHDASENSNPPHIRSSIDFTITMSGFLTCEACNAVNCIVDTKQFLSSASRTPYFTSTNLNESGMISNLKMNRDTTLRLECYASGRPNPEVTWFKATLASYDRVLLIISQSATLKGNKLLRETNQFKLAHNNRQLTILFFLDDDDERYMCRADNQYGTTKKYIDITIEGKGGQDVLRSSFIAAASVLLVIIVISWLVIWKQQKEATRKRLIDLAFKEGALKRFNPELPVVDQAELLPYDHKWEFPRELLTLDKVLGSGAFGIVRKAEARSICRGEPLTTVAVKLVRSKASLNFMTALSRELKILVYLGKHPNVVNLLGACTKNVSYGELFVIVEFCRFGNLRDYLLRRRPDFFKQIRSKTGGTIGTTTDSEQLQIDSADETLNSNDGLSMEGCGQRTDCTSTDSMTDGEDASGENSNHTLDIRFKYRGDYADLNLEEISTHDLVYWSWQVSRGMEYLGERKIVHGDLAARNVLLADNNIAKICDFGMSKALYDEAQYRDKGHDPLPLRWMAIESIKDRVFSVQSDVWSFGVVMWEFFSLGETPYHGIRHRELHQKLVDGYRMDHPKFATNTIYETMLGCWESDPSKRPTFNELSQSIGDLLDEGFKTQYEAMISPYMEMNADMFENGKKDYLTMPPSAFDAASSSTVHGEIEMKNLPQNESANPK